MNKFITRTICMTLISVLCIGISDAQQLIQKEPDITSGKVNKIEIPNPNGIGANKVAYAIDRFSGMSVTVPLDNPENFSYHYSMPFDPPDGDWIDGEWCVLHYLSWEIYKINPVTGDYSVAGALSQPFSTGISYNPADGYVYVLNVYGIYRGTLATGINEYVTSVPNLLYPSSIAFTNDGRCIAVDVKYNRLVEIDLTTSATIPIMQLPVNASDGYWQGLAIDRETNTMYCSTFDGDTHYGGFYRINLDNNTMTYLGSFGYNSYMMGFAIPTEVHETLCPPPTNLTIGFIEDYTIPQLTWTASSGDVDYLYNIYFDGQLIEEDVTDTYYNVNNIIFDNTITHQWCVQTICENGASEEVCLTMEALEPGKYAIHTTYGAGGTISPNGDVYVPAGTDKTFLITPKLGYKIDQVWVDGDYDGNAVTNKYHTFTNVQEEHWLSATFTYISIEQYYINATASTVGGTITPSGKVLVTTGDDKKFTFTPQAGYKIKEVLVDGINNLAAVVAGEYTFYDIVCAHTIDVKFEKQTFVIAASITTAGGTIAPLGESTVTYGGSKAYTITAQTGYLIDEALVDGTNNPTAVSSGKYTFSNVVDNHTIVASFKQREYEITATQTANGTVTPAGITTVLHGNNMTYNITPDAGYMIKTVLVDGKNNTSAVALGFYTFTNVTAKHTITATYVPTTGAPATGEGSELSLYPNPTSGEFWVSGFGFNVTGIEIFDVMGKKAPLNPPEGGRLPSFGGVGGGFDISQFPSGVYFIRIQTENGVVVRKVVKQ